MNDNLEQYAIEQFKRAISSELNGDLERMMEQIELGNHYKADYYATLHLGNQRLPLVLEVKGHLTNLNQVKSIINFAKTFDGLCLVICEAVSQPIKSHLKELGLGFYEIGIELHLPLSLKVKGPSKGFSEDKITRSLGFRTDSSTKILFYFACDPNALKLTQRDLAQKLGLSLSTTNAALKNLEKLDCIKILSNSRKLLGDFDLVVDRWRYQFLDIERKKLSIGRFSPINDSFYSDWKKISLDQSYYWGAECAASLVTGYLTPGFFTIYTYETKLGEILRKLRLKKDQSGKIEILHAFWPEDLNSKIMNVVPNFLTYCDLLNSSNSRNKETAVLMKKNILNTNWDVDA